MVSRRLAIKFYLWFLLGLTLTVAATAAVVALWPDDRWGLRIEQRIMTAVTLARDLSEQIVTHGGNWDTVRTRLTPLLEQTSTSLAVTTGKGAAVFIMRNPDAPADFEIAPSAEQLRTVIEHGSLLTFRPGREIAAALPIELANGEQGIFHVTAHPHGWRDHSPPYHALAGIAVVLLVGWVLTWPLARHLTKPMREMARVADIIGKGDLQARIELRRKDELGQLAASINGMAENLQRLLVGHKRLLADISHELRSPLARLRVALELSRGASTKALDGYLIRCENQVQEIDALIDELLTYSRLELTPYELRPETVDLVQLLEETLESMTHDLQSRGIRTDLQVPRTAPTITADRALLARALANVLRNALAHSPQGAGIEVRVEPSGGGFSVAVTDEGAGVAPEHRESIFQPFVRTDSARQRSTGGVGLGLAIVRSAVEAHGGKVWVEEGPGERGLRLQMWLPRDAPQAQVGPNDPA